MREALREADFPTVPNPEIVGNFVRQGCILLRNFADPMRLLELKEVLSPVYEEVNGPHVFQQHLAERGLPDFMEYVFCSEKHHELLKLVYKGYKHRLLRGSARRVEPEGLGHGGPTWQAPLGPHLDAALHNFQFTLQFWVPLQPCGVDSPSLGVVCTDFDDVLKFVGFDGGQPVRGPAGEWNYGNFSPILQQVSRKVPSALETFRSQFADQIWTPSYDLGDAMMLSNWTYHFSHSASGMQKRRENVEFRFTSNASLREVLDAHAVAA